MYPMIQNRFKAPVTKVITPLCRAALRAGLSANALTAIGALGVSISAIYFFPKGEFFIGTILVSIFALSDLFDGTMARLTNSQGTKWGALLDSTLDRVSDAAICIGIWAYLESVDSNSQYLALAALVFGGLIPYVRARAEGLGIRCDVGIAERAERLILLLGATALEGLGIEGALTFALSILLLLSIITTGQRLLVVYRA
jgi:CDP-diacylglycerol--glycerol-3-phosphate 3-phosphatidyltransferase